ncbi:hypothetical protein JX265_006892 [Neoarthrinium moseri]|uniref:Uncharacterized protein n=1 Tax=Neoarthrinium moseri TaxID=1658444 RepID=A0A9Q0AP65_9PEZI|nr:uncharacterized protein JN550_002634 [Neoarthrinium moseri]KAI1842265.1 hypothetical protein JX266_011550 [Neoarthrinium moseri]KAI1868913.1 hypothetical protein JX265_006892 [Neoarthrinium moseri]KAI1874055.1 hypothetical protein JN550_002634 [Neoarthrinium moseri]
MDNDKKQKFVQQLIDAVKADDINGLRALLDSAEEPISKYNYAYEALNTALRLGRYDIEDELMRRGARWTYESIQDVVDGGDESNSWNTKAVDVAIANGWDVHTEYEHVGNALVHVVSMNQCHIPMIAHLIAKGADPNEGRQTYSNPLEIACEIPDLQVAKFLIEHGATVKGTSALREASITGDVELVRLLLDKGADINEIPPENGRPSHWVTDERWGTPLHAAVYYDRVECVKFLLENGAAQDIRNPSGVTPLELAKKRGNDEILRLFK